MVGLGIPAYHSKLAAALPTAAALSIWPQIDTRCSGAGRFEEWNNGGRKYAHSIGTVPQEIVALWRHGSALSMCCASRWRTIWNPKANGSKHDWLTWSASMKPCMADPEDREDHEVHRANLVEYRGRRARLR